jgi:hypothetical protein
VSRDPTRSSIGSAKADDRIRTDDLLFTKQSLLISGDLILLSGLLAKFLRSRTTVAPSYGRIAVSDPAFRFIFF